MSAEHNAWRRLDALISGLEDEVLKLDDLAILSQDEGSIGDIERVRALILSRLEACASIKHSESDTDIETVSSGYRNRRAEPVPILVPEEAAERRRLLETLVANRRNVPEQVRIAFSAGVKPTDLEVDTMVRELVRLGILKATENDD